MRFDHLLVIVSLGEILQAASIPLQQDIRNTKLELVRWEVLQDRRLRLHVVLDLEVGEEDDGGVGGEEDEDVPGAVEVGESYAGPPGAEDPVIDPAGDGHAPEDDAPAAQGEHALVLLRPQLHRQHAAGGQLDEGKMR